LVKKKTIATKLIVAFRNFANAPKKHILLKAVIWI